jgi:hypothetical protein
MILTNSSSYRLSQEVEKYLSMGWKLQGGVAYSMSMASEYYAQAMIKEKI